MELIEATRDLTKAAGTLSKFKPFERDPSLRSG